MVTNRKLILMLLFITCSMHVMAQTDYYFYKGKKVPLILNENKVVVSTPKDCKETCERILANVQVLSMIKDDDLDIFVIPPSDYDKLTKQDSWAEDAKNVILTFCYFTEDNAEVIATPYLNVELKKEEDIELLASYAEKYKLRFDTWQSMFFPLLYNLASSYSTERLEQREPTHLCDWPSRDKRRQSQHERARTKFKMVISIQQRQFKLYETFVYNR